MLKQYSIRITVCFFILAGTFICGCSKEPEQEKLTTINIAFQEWVGYGLFYLAQEKGFCRDEGIDLFFVDEQLDSARRDAFKAGMLDCEGGTLDLLISKISQATPIVAVLSLDYSFGGDGIVANADIKTIDDLIGKRIALSVDDVSDTFLSTLLHKMGRPLDSVSIVSKMPQDVAQAFLNGEADACVTWQPWLDEALKRPGSHLLTSTKEYPGIIIDTLNVRMNFVKDKPHVVKGLLRAWFRAIDFYKKYPEESSAIIAKYYNITPLEYQQQAKGLIWVDYEEQIKHEWRSQLVEVFDLVSEIKFARGKMGEKPEVQKHIDHSLLETLYEDKK